MTAIPRRVIAVWAVLAVLMGVVAAIELTDRNRSPSGRVGVDDPRWLLPLPVDRLGAIEIADAGALHRFERSATGVWFYHGAHSGSEGTHTHPVDPAVAQRIEQALLAFGRTRIERQLPRGSDPKAFGVTAPRMVILVYRPNESQPLVQYAVGDVAPDTASRYVDVIGGSGVVTIPNYQIENLAALVELAKGAPVRQAGTPTPR
ncbi:MAG TPA: hypothetical protein VGT40_19525 [Methylomirabilota bacterium]|nr:hypothetical protein [Methylomirabilota bacterium]